MCVNSLGLQGDPGGMTDLPKATHLVRGTGFYSVPLPSRGGLPEGLEPGILRGERAAKMFLETVLGFELE